MLLADAIKLLVGNDIPLAIQCYDGSRLGPEDAASKIIVRSPRALRHMVWSPGELGIARAYVAGDLDFEGSIFDLFALRDKLPNPKLGPREWIAFLRILGLKGLKNLSDLQKKSSCMVAVIRPTETKPPSLIITTFRMSFMN